MGNLQKEDQLKGVSSFWNSTKIDKWDKKYDDYNPHTMRYVNSRQKKIMDMIHDLKLEKGSTVLELGYGAGQTAVKLVQAGLDYEGVDISQRLCDISKSRCDKECGEGKYNFRVGSIEETLPYDDNSFDVIVCAGVLQYLFSRKACIDEAYRVLKPGGHFILAQCNAYSIGCISSLRGILRCIFYFLLREKNELYPSYYSLLIDSKLGKVFSRFKNTKLFQSKFMQSGIEDRKYTMEKRINTYWSLKKLVRNSGFKIIKSTGAYFPLTEKSWGFDINLKFDDFMEKYFSKILFPYCRTIVLLTTKQATVNETT